MKASLLLPTDHVTELEEFVTVEAVAEMAEAAEAAGFDAVNVTEHPLPDDEWMASGGHHALEPFVTLAVAAARTTRLRLHTNLTVVPYRAPGLLAKAIATLDQLSGGRTIIGVGAGYQEGEFRALGIDFARRNELTDEGLRMIDAIFSGRSVDGNTALPRPAQRPRPPLWVGGNSRLAMRRSVDLADGWSPIPNPRRLAARRHTPALETPEDLRVRVDELRAYAASVGRSGPFELPFMPFGVLPADATTAAASAYVREMEELAKAGATYLVVAVPAARRDELLAGMDWWSRHLLPGLEAIETRSPLEAP